ncbi:MAG: universal stress protein [Methanohalobium sp.]|uniref:universal stress protein n=1 Tax=Methanohalobium sp. TaxID=2837493 RepID=UPI00397E8803
MANEQFKRILIATDGSKNSQNAVNSGIEIAKMNNAEVYALYVIPPVSAPSAQRSRGWAESLKQDLTEDGKESTKHVKDVGSNAGIDVESVLLEGDPGEEIISFADKNNIDLIVIGSLGRSGIQKFLLGSVAEKVVRNSKKHVLVVP